MKKGQRRVFVLIGHYTYEGYDKPEGVFPSRAAAEAFYKEHIHPRTYDNIDILEYIVDAK